MTKRLTGLFAVFVLAFAVLTGAGLKFARAQESLDETASQPVQETLSLKDALAHTYSYNPALNVARAELKVVEERLPQAFAGWRPTVLTSVGITKTDIDGSALGGDGSTSKDLSLALDQPLFRGGRTVAEIAAARHTISAQEALLLAKEQATLLEATTAYMDVVRDEALLKLSENSRDVIAKELQATKDRFEVGEITKTDVSQAQARLARADSQVISAQGSLNASRATFEQVIGVKPLGLSQEAAQLAIEMPANLDEAVARAQQESPAVLFAVSAHKASEEDIHNVYGELLPKVSLEGFLAKSYDPSPGLVDDETTKSIGVTASIPLYQGGAVRSRVRQAKYTENQKNLEIQNSKLEAQQKVVSEWANLLAAKAEIASRQAQVEASRLAQEGVRAEAEFGTRTVLDALDAEQELLDAEVAQVIAQRNETVAKFSLLATLGLLLPETLGFADNPDNSAVNPGDQKTSFLNMNVDRVQ